MPASVHTQRISVERTARVAMLGTPARARRWWIVLHGYGQRAEDFLGAFRPVATTERCIVAPEGLSRFYVDAMEEHRRVGASWMTRDAREDEIADYVRYLDALWSQLTDDASSPPEHLTVLGFSQGAATASRWCTYGAAPIDRLVLWAGDLAHDVDLTEHAASWAGWDLAVVWGDEDPYLSDDRKQALLQRLASHNLSAEVHTFAGAHRLDRAVLRELARSTG
jgi:predicted esterase